MFSSPVSNVVPAFATAVQLACTLTEITGESEAFEAHGCTKM